MKATRAMQAAGFVMFMVGAGGMDSQGIKMITAGVIALAGLGILLISARKEMDR